MSASNLELLADAFAGWGKDSPAKSEMACTPSASSWFRTRSRMAAPSGVRTP